MSQPALCARFKDLTSDQRQELRTWWANVCEEGEKPGPVGLWVCGPRRGGTSYVGEVAMRKIVRETGTGYWDRVEAAAVVQAVRQTWSFGDLLRHNQDDYGLWKETAAVEDELALLWSIPYLWIDDFQHEVVDVNFWRKHVQGRVEQRVKQRKPTIVCTTLTPDHPELAGLERVITDLFVVSYAGR
jgi:hypothetical protein